MLKITIPASEQYDELTNTFITIKEQTLCLEHSLISISQWESKWKKPFLSKDERSNEESLDYVKCMTLNKNVPDEAYLFLTDENMMRIQQYINDPMTATKIYDNSKEQGKVRTITSELIYCWMCELELPVEFEKWHLNRLITLIRLCNIERNPNKKKMSQKEILAQNAAINKARREQLKSKG